MQTHDKVKQEATLGKGGVLEYCNNNNITAVKWKKEGNVSELVTVQSVTLHKLDKITINLESSHRKPHIFGPCESQG
jgi:hypothetical protein